MKQTEDPVLAPLAQRPPAPAGAHDAQPRLEPLPWPGMSKAECALLAILVDCVSRAQEAGR